MARKKQSLNIFEPTEAEKAQPEGNDLDAGKVKSVGVGLREGELAALEGIAKELGVTRNQLMRYAIRDFLNRYQAGKVKLETETKTELKMP